MLLLRLVLFVEIFAEGERERCADEHDRFEIDVALHEVVVLVADHVDSFESVDGEIVDAESGWRHFFEFSYFVVFLNETSGFVEVIADYFSHT